MTKATTPPANGGTLSNVDYERLMALSSANVEALMKTGQAMLKGLAKLNEELAGFASTRLKEQVEGSRALAQCGNWSEALDKQMGLARTATEQYLTEASKLANLAAEVSVASWAPLQSYVQTTLGELGSTARKA